ncbi:hypothetical protein [Actinoplanes teichomyceticus]|uniref:Uncharacterized protein n=1 Tax=Actinoplanes teichomyceticus TaxID=1867 RepID=A0A561VCT3_ACTTI|nr:hypothetical protein [Actinoplanes teichomyceticus]TWG09407.1 hypothetical protein FHX34_108122 [Actinoplanes teichomyceticus]GIF17010.1 hypothetical protein Ate01nite_70420 [Actinoplanes teichomyceticus]
MAYTPDKPKLTETVEELRARIPGWGADLDPKDRPSVPREVFDPEFSGAHWEFPERQPEKWPRERSIEHKFLTPVFGTSCPPRGLSGAIRRHSYARYSEGRAAHWLLLLAADRVDVVESRMRALLSGRPDRLIAETGVRAELPGRGLRSRVGRTRADMAHHPLDPVVVAAPWIVGAGIAYAVVRRLAGRGTR